MILNQLYFIQRILCESGLSNSNPKDVPSVKPLLQKESKSHKLTKEPFYYRSVKSMLIYLTCTKPDIFSYKPSFKIQYRSKASALQCSKNNY